MIEASPVPPGLGLIFTKTLQWPVPFEVWGVLAFSLSVRAWQVNGGSFINRKRTARVSKFNRFLGERVFADCMSFPFLRLWKVEIRLGHALQRECCERLQLWRPFYYKRRF